MPQKEKESVSKDVNEWYKIEPTKNITVTEIKILMNDLSSRVSNTEERVRELKDRTIKITWSEQQTKQL